MSLATTTIRVRDTNPRRRAPLAEHAGLGPVAALELRRVYLALGHAPEAIELSQSTHGDTPAQTGAS